MGPDDVTATWLAERLGGEVGGIHTERIGDGLVGLNLRVMLVDAAPELPRSVVLKLPSLDETSRATGVALRNYEREVKFYLQLADTVDIRMPHCHHGEWDEGSGDFVLVLEDMAPAAQGDQIAGCSLSEAESAVSELARLHGPRWDDEQLHDVDWLGRRVASEDGLQLAMLWSMMYPGFETTFGGHLTANALDLVRQFGPVVAQWVEGHSGPLAVTHGDFRLDNLFFFDDGTMAVIDWQMSMRAPGQADFVYFCANNLATEMRREHERDLLERYVAELHAGGVPTDAITAESVWQGYLEGLVFYATTFGASLLTIDPANERGAALFDALVRRTFTAVDDLDAGLALGFDPTG